MVLTVVDDTGAWRTFTAMDFLHGHKQPMVQRLPQPVVAPQVKLAPDGRYRRRARRQHPPRQTAFTKRRGSPPRSAASAIGEDARHAMAAEKRRQQRPFGIGQITWQSQTRARMMDANGIGLHRGSVESLSQNLQNQRSGHASRQSADTTQFNFDQALVEVIT